MSILEELNDQQKEAVTTTEGPILIIAGAGSGKTRALTHRIAYLIKEVGVLPWQILGVTFTNKAAGEMKNRICQLLGITPAKPWEKSAMDQPTMGTFHSICAQILRQEIHHLGYENQFVIFDDGDQLSLVKKIMKELEIDVKNFNPKAVLGAISSAKNRLTDSDKYSIHADDFFHEHVARIYTCYQKALRKANALDFDDLLMITVQLFQAREDILIKYQERWQYIHVDEYQDTNHAQYILIKLLASAQRNVCVVGDPDQSIYSWRGADITNILNFKKDYPEAKKVLLEENYRSTQNILECANKIITKNKGRVEKKLWTANDAGDKIVIAQLESEKDEAEFILNEIKNSKRKFRDFVVLYRTNAQSRIIEEALLRFGIPYKIIGGVKFYKRKEVKDVIAYLRLIHNPADDISLLRIINTPSRKLGARTLEIVQQYAYQNSLPLYKMIERVDEIQELNDAKKQTLKKFYKLIETLRETNKEFNASHVLKDVVTESGYGEFLLDGTEEGETRMDNVRELISVSQKYDGLEQGVGLATFLEEVALVSDTDELNLQDNYITLMTLHSAKGLEYPVVFIMGMEEGIFPHSRSILDPQQLEEERRLAYVGMTRAMEKLHLTLAKNRLLYGEYQSNAPSQFIADLPKDLVDMDAFNEKGEKGFIDNLKRILDKQEYSAPEVLSPSKGDEHPRGKFKDGDKVTHKTFGEGRIVQLQGDIATIAFQDPKVGIKKLAMNIAPIQKI